MTSRRSPRSTRLSRAFRRLGLVLPALFLALVSLADYQVWKAEQLRLALIADDTGLSLRRPDVARRLWREPDPVHARLELGAALLADELDPSWQRDLPAADRDAEQLRALERLRVARGLAEGALESRPAAWRAPLIVGGSTYLERFRLRDPRLLAESAAWERPLQTAHRLGPAHQEPLRFLAAAYLGNWSGLGAEGRARAEEVLRLAFTDDRTQELLLESWLRVAPSLRRALELLPRTSGTWRRLQRYFARRNDWERYALAYRGRLDALDVELPDLIEEAERHRRHGDALGARRLLLDVIRHAPADLRYADVARQVMERLPPGPVGAERGTDFRAWLTWALDLCIYRDCPLPPQTLARFSRAVRLEPAAEALAALAAGDLARAELFERRQATRTDPAWGEYFIFKARRWIELQEPSEAAKTLDRVPFESAGSALFWSTRALLETADNADRPSAAVTARIEAARRTSWPGYAWQWRGRSARLELLAAGGAEGLRLRISEAPRQGGAIEVRWDGAAVRVAPIASGATLDVEVPVSPELHLLEMVPLEGLEIRPGAVALVAEGDLRRASSRPRPPGPPPA